MKRIIFITIIAISSVSISLKSNAQNQEFGAGSSVINVGVGFGYDYGYLGTFFPALTVSGDWGLKVNAGPGTIGLGGIVGFKYGYYDYSFDGYSAGYSETIIAVRGTYHWTPPGAPKLDLYGGIPVGFRFDHYSEWDYNVTGLDAFGDPIYGYYRVTGTSVEPFFGLFVGAAYYFNGSVGIFGELGYDVSAFTLGVSFKLK